MTHDFQTYLCLPSLDHCSVQDVPKNCSVFYTKKKHLAACFVDTL